MPARRQCVSSVPSSSVSIKLMARVWELALPSKEQAVLLCLADHANDDGRAFPSIAFIAWKLGKSGRAVQRALGELEARGIVTRESHASGGRRAGTLVGQPTIFLLDLEKGVKKSPFRAKKGDAGVAKRVTVVTPKGDISGIASTRTINNHQGTCPQIKHRGACNSFKAGDSDER